MNVTRSADMTGNVVPLGFGLAGAARLPVVSPLVSLAAFVLGAVAGGLLAGTHRRAHQVYLRAALVIEFTLAAMDRRQREPLDAAECPSAGVLAISPTWMRRGSTRALEAVIRGC